MKVSCRYLPGIIDVAKGDRIVDGEAAAVGGDGDFEEAEEFGLVFEGRVLQLGWGGLGEAFGESEPILAGLEHPERAFEGGEFAGDVLIG